MADRIGQQLGNYRLTRLLGQGGFAEVYLGKHIHLDTLAAIKVLHTQLGSDDVEKFRTEARTIARLIHPYIVRVLDFGVENNTPYLVMDYAPHGTLRQRHPKGTQLPLDLIVSYVNQVTEALQYAHEKKLIHRDIKPENLLLGETNQVLLSDFGIALVAQSTHYQNTQEVIGTAVYMAPEQLRGKPRYASDQYSLGVVVYEWICGDRPFHGSFTEIYSQHMFVPPPPLHEKVPEIPSAIEEVVLTALAKDPEQRFVSVKAFAIALAQASEATHLTAFAPQSELLGPTGAPLPHTQHIWPTVAVPSSSQPLQKGSMSTPITWVKLSQGGISRRTVLIGLGGVTLVGIAGGIMWLTNSQGIQKAPVSISSGQTPSITAISHPTTSTPTPYSPPIGTTLLTYRGHSSWIAHAAWSPDGTRVASGAADNTVQIWNATTGQNTLIYRGHSQGVNCVPWSPDGTRIASGAADNTVQIWNAATGENFLTYHGHTDIVRAVAWSPDGTRIASGSHDTTVQIWNASNGTTIFTYKGHSNRVSSVAWSPDGTRIASGSDDHTAQVWDANTGGNALTYHGHTDIVRAVSWSPNGKRIVSGSHDDSVQVWQAISGKNVLNYHGHSEWVYTAAWSLDAAHIASAGADHTVQVWDATTGNNAFTYRGHSSAVNTVAWSPDSKRIASAGFDLSVQLWQAV